MSHGFPYDFIFIFDNNNNNNNTFKIRFYNPRHTSNHGYEISVFINDTWCIDIIKYIKHSTGGVPWLKWDNERNMTNIFVRPQAT